MRSIWKGAITFGLVNVPVKVYSATEDHDVSLHQVHDKDGGRIRYQRRCEIDGEIVEYEHIAKAYDDGDRTVIITPEDLASLPVEKAYDDGDRTVIITPEDLASLPVEKSREIDVVEFVPSDQIDPIMFDKSYYLEPDSKSAKAYVLLRRTLEQSDRTAIVKFALRQKTRLAALRVMDDVLVLQTLLWGDEVREAGFPSLKSDVEISDRELKMSASLVASFESDFTPEKYTDEYQEQLRQLIDAKLEQGESLDTAATFGESDEDEDGGEVLDLMEALRRSVEQSRAKKSGSGDSKSGAAKGAKKTSSAKAEKSDDAKKPAKKRA